MMKWKHYSIRPLFAMEMWDALFNAWYYFMDQAQGNIFNVTNYVSKFFCHNKLGSHTNPIVKGTIFLAI